jgi:LysR family transcriptional activator of nhaA
MDWLNYHHLLYFWTVARTGTVTAASEELRLAPSTISGQIQQLEESLGDELFRRSGRRLVLTDFGRTVFRYAEEIFGIGRELKNFVEGRSTSGRLRLHVGVTEVVPKLVVRRLLEPVLAMDRRVHLIVSEGHADELVSDLARHHLDVAITDAPTGPESAVRTYNHLLTESTVGFFGTAECIGRLEGPFPDGLDEQPLLMPTANSMLRRRLESWFDDREIVPVIVGEFQDAAQLKTLGQAGLGLFPAPEMVAEEVERQYGVECVGTVENLTEEYYAVSVEKRERHPAVRAMLEET